MPEFFLELFSEEIPARLQPRGAEALGQALGRALAPLSPANPKLFWGPRRIALALDVAAELPPASLRERGPRVSAPEAALAGFLRKHDAAREDVVRQGDYWVLEKTTPAIAAASLIGQMLPDILRRLPWPRSMRWGQGSAFTWIRPLRRILCLLDGAVVPFDLRDDQDRGHGLVSGNLTEGHRFHASGAFAVTGCADWLARLHAAQVLADPAARAAQIGADLANVAATAGLALVEDADLLAEVAGLVEWPVVLLGGIDAAYMDLPPEVMQVSMRVNQRYFALRRPDGTAAPHFAFVANIAASDGGAAIIAGNERVLRARFADARHFWDLDRQVRLEQRLAALDGIVFHAALGSQGARAARLATLASHIANMLGVDAALSARAALLAKADLTTGMVGEFPELQGIMGGYYASHDGEPPEIAQAIAQHYRPRGPADAVPQAPIAQVVALADKLDQLAGLFAAGERPSGSGDPYALRRAALGMIRIVLENRLRVRLSLLVAAAVGGLPDGLDRGFQPDLQAFIQERFRVQLRTEGHRHDMLDAVLGRDSAADDDLVQALARADAVAAFLATAAGADLLAGYRRAANILRIEDRRDGPHGGAPDPALFVQDQEAALAEALASGADLRHMVANGRFAAAMDRLAQWRAPVDAFFAAVTVNDMQPERRLNRLRLLAQLRDAMDLVADFSRIAG